MDKEEANKIITEYMDEESETDMFNGALGGCFPTFSNMKYISLDALVPVWEKLNLPRILEIDISEKSKPSFSYRYYTQLGYSHSAEGETIQEAAVIATVKAIKELTETTQ